MVFGFSKRHFLGLAHSVLAAAAQGVQRLGQRLVVSWGWGHPAAALPHSWVGLAPGHSSALQSWIFP